MSIDIYSMVTDRIIEALEAGTVPWHKPWKGGDRHLPRHWPPYSLLNQLLFTASLFCDIINSRITIANYGGE